MLVFVLLWNIYRKQKSFKFISHDFCLVDFHYGVGDS